MEQALTPEQMQEIWNEEATILETGDQAAETAVDAAALDANQPPEETPPTEAEANQAEVPEETDPFASLPDAVKAKLAEIDELKQFNQQLMQHVKTAEGRVSAMQREFDIARNAAQNANGSAPSDKQLLDAAKNPEEWEQMKSDFPDLADAWEKKMAAELARININAKGLTTEEVGEFVRGQVDAVKVETRRLVEEARIEGKYEDWREIVNTSDFASWFAVQKPEVKALADSTLAKDAIQMLNLFHEAKANTATAIKQDRSQRLQAAAGSLPKNRSTPTPRSVDDMSAAELWEFEARKREKERAERGF